MSYTLCECGKMCREHGPLCDDCQAAVPTTTSDRKPQESYEITASSSFDFLPPFLINTRGGVRPYGNHFHGRTIGTRKAMRAASKRRRIHARASKRKGGAL